jgi:predicted permease
VTNLRGVDLGFPQDGLLYARVAPRSGNVPVDQRAQFVHDALDRIRELPGVGSASAGTTLPLGNATNVGSEPSAPFCSPEQAAAGRLPVTAASSLVAPGYFDTLGISQRAGRDLTWDDGPRTRAVVVNERFVQAMWPGDSPEARVGGQITMCGPQGPWVIAGVVADVANASRSAPQPTVYWPLGNSGMPITLMIRTVNDPASLIPSVRRAVTSVNADVPTFSEATAPALRERTLRRERLLALLIGGFGVVTAAICALGIYALLAYAVSRRRAEIGIRMAIGASGADVVRLVCRESLAAVAVGGAVGIGASLALTRVLGSLLFGVSALDAWVLGGAIAAFAVVAVVAAALPARAAVRVDPLLALRQV